MGTINYQPTTTVRWNGSISKVAGSTTRTEFTMRGAPGTSVIFAAFFWQIKMKTKTKKKKVDYKGLSHLLGFTAFFCKIKVKAKSVYRP